MQHSTPFFLRIQQGIIFILLSLSSFANSGDLLFNEVSKTNIKSKTGNWFKNRPVKFLENKGQMMDMNNAPASFILFKAEAPGVDFYITEKGLSYVFLEMKEEENEKEKQLRHNGYPTLPKMGTEEQIKVTWERLDMNLPGANIKRENIIKENASAHFYNYYYNYCPKGIKDVKDYEKITIKNIYPGIDWVFYNSTKTGFKYDFIVHPGANASQIKLVYSSLKPIQLNEEGGLTVKTKMGQLSENAPYSYLQLNNQKVESSFKLLGQRKLGAVFESTVGFKFNSTTTFNQTLIIDPQLVWATFYGANAFEGTFSMDTDNSGNVFMCGYSISANFPLLNSGTYFLSSGTCFLLKFSNSGVLLWATFLSVNSAASLITDNSGNLFLTGSVTGNLLPVMNAGTYFQGTNGGGNDAFITKFDNVGNMLWSTYYGGSGIDVGKSLAKDNAGNIFMCGTTTSNNFPVLNAGTYFQGGYLGGVCSFVAKFDNLGNSIWSTYYHGINVQASTIDLNGNILMTGAATGTTLPLLNPGGTTYFQAVNNGISDAFVVKFDNFGNQLWSTYYGGSSNDVGHSLITDKTGNLFILGATTSTDLPVQNAGTFYQGSISASTLISHQDMFILKFNPSGTRLWATYFGGKDDETIGSSDNIEVDTCGNIYVAFDTRSANVPTINSCLTSFYKPNLDTVPQGFSDIFIAEFSNSGIHKWGTYFGGDGIDFRSCLDIDFNSALFITGEWSTVNNTQSYPIIKGPTPLSYTNTYQGSDDIYITKFIEQQPNQSFSYALAICKNDTNLLPFKSAGFVNGGNYSAGTGLSINPLNGQISPSASIPGTYTVSYHLTFSCSCLTQHNYTTLVTITALPNLTISPSTTICAGNKTVNTVTGANSYTWNTGQQTNTISVSPTLTTTYTVNASGTNGCKSTATTEVAVSKCLDIPETTKINNLIRIYPNPNSGEFTIESQQNIKLNLFNELGQVIQEIELNSTNARKIRISNLAEGIYFLNGDVAGEKLNYKILVSE